jgi:hypothetical protein
MPKPNKPKKDGAPIRVNVIFKGSSAEKLLRLCEVSGLDYANLLRFLVSTADPEKLRM